MAIDIIFAGGNTYKDVTNVVEYDIRRYIFAAVIGC